MIWFLRLVQDCGFYLGLVSWPQIADQRPWPTMASTIICQFLIRAAGWIPVAISILYSPKGNMSEMLVSSCSIFSAYKNTTTCNFMTIHTQNHIGGQIWCIVHKWLWLKKRVWIACPGYGSGPNIFSSHISTWSSTFHYYFPLHVRIFPHISTTFPHFHTFPPTCSIHCCF